MTTRRLAAVKFENAFNHFIIALQEYQEGYKLEFNGDNVADDGVLGVAYQEIYEAVCTMLNGPLGRLDGGTTHSRLLEIAKKAGLDVE